MSSIFEVRQENNKFYVYYSQKKRNYMTKVYKNTVPNTVIKWMLSASVDVKKTKSGAIWTLKKMKCTLPGRA